MLSLLWSRLSWLAVAIDVLFHTAEEKMLSFWESPSLMFMGNLAAVFIFFPLSKIKTNTPAFSFFPHGGPPIRLTSHGCFGKSLNNGQRVCALADRLPFSSFENPSIAFFGKCGCNHGVWGCSLSEGFSFFQTFSFILWNWCQKENSYFK